MHQYSDCAVKVYVKRFEFMLYANTTKKNKNNNNKNKHKIYTVVNIEFGNRQIKMEIIYVQKVYYLNYINNIMYYYRNSWSWTIVQLREGSISQIEI